MNWNTLIPQHQIGVDSNAPLSFYTHLVGNKLYILTLENPLNLNLANEEEISLFKYNNGRFPKDAMLMLIPLNLNDGKFKKENLSRFNPRKTSEVPFPTKTMWISETEALMYADGKKTFKIGKIVFKK